MIRSSLIGQLFFFFMVVIVLSLVSLGFFTYLRSSIELKKINDEHLEQIVTNALNHTDLFVRTYERSMLSLMTDSNVKKFVDLPKSPDPYDVYRLGNEIKTTAFSPIFIRNPEVTSIYIIGYSGNAAYGVNSGMNVLSFPPEATAQHLEELTGITRDDGSVSFLTNSIYTAENRNVLRLARRIKGQFSPEYKGILALELTADDMSMLWQGVRLGKRGFFFVTDERGIIIYHPKGERIGHKVEAVVGNHIAISNDLSFTSKDENGEEWLYVKRKSSHTGWSLVASVPVNDLKKPISNIRSTTIMIAIITLIVALWISYQFGRSITRPIGELIRGMTQTEKGNWMTISPAKQKNEIGELTRRYNMMVHRLSELIDQVYEGEIRRKEIQYERQQAEYQSLQMQINPHFLYNTLETIACYAAIRESAEIEDIVKSMAYMMRYSVQTNIEEITVANELNHVLNYMTILKHRTEREFEIDVAIPPKFLLRKMVRLTLQPLIENVFSHAFGDCIEDHHWIRIDAREEGDTFYLTVEDNGIGIPQEKLRELEQRLQQNRLTDHSDGRSVKTSGIGLVNVHRRIQMIFGEGSGLRIDSKMGAGTKVTMVMKLAFREKAV
jgi:two-component system, sensor histidine kinase YesM